MSFYGITNLNQYAAMQNYKTNPAKQSQSTTPTDTTANKPKTDTPKAESDSKNDAVKMDIKQLKEYLKPTDDPEENQRRREERRMNPDDARKSLESSHPKAESVQRSAENAAKYGPIQAKMLSGKPLTDEEKSFLRENYPEAYSMAARIEAEVKMLKEQLSGCKSKADADQLIAQKKMQALGGGKGDNLSIFLIPAFDEAYNGYKA